MFTRLTMLSLVVSLSACNDGTNNPITPPEGPGLGAACTAETKCRTGLACDATSMTCQGARASADGTACTLGVECTSGHCAPNSGRGICAPAGTRTRSESCEGDAQCAAGLKCGFSGESLFPECLPAGTKDIGAACTLGLECAQGLLCIQSVCAIAPLSPAMTPNGYPPVLPGAPGTGWKGATCPTAAPAATTALFVLPRDSDDPSVKEDFYRLPYPNDALRDANGRIDFSRHPKDPSPMFGFDLLGRYFDALATEPFGNAPTVLMRFDGPLDFSTIDLPGAQRVRLVNLTPGRTGTLGFSLLSSQGGGKYICNNWLGVRTFDGDSLAQGTYAVVLLKGLKGQNAGEIAPSADFTAMLSTTIPTEPRQALAWPSYAPLRAWLAAQTTPVELVNAAVFTVGNPRRLVERLATAVSTAPAPTAETWVKCGSGTPSPCTDVTGPRACGSSTAFDEWHTLIELPIFQQGTAPYLTPAMGGAIDSSSLPLTPVRTEKVCATLTVPTGTAPSGGWPVVLYAHGTGGSFRSHAGDGAAATAASITLPGVTTGPVQAAMLGFDQVGHGPRRGAAGQNSSPDDIVFNFANPASGRGTMAQGAADLMGVTKYLKNLPTAFPSELPPLDVSRLAFWGHSQGATEGALFLAVDRSIDGALMTGASATLVHSLTSKKAPVNIADGMWAALGESTPGPVSVFHPVLGLLQSWTDVVDPLHFAGRNVLVPANGTTAPAFARSVFQVWGKDDLFTPRPVQTSYARAAALAFVGPQVDSFDVTPVTSASGNLMMPRRVTAAMRQYVPDGYDGHFVVFRNPAATTDAARFVGRVLRGEVPTVPEP